MLYDLLLYRCPYYFVAFLCEYINYFRLKKNVVCNTGNPADFCKGKADGFYKDPASCSHFYSCSYGVSYHEPCPARTYFSDALQGCDWATNVPNCP